MWRILTPLQRKPHLAALLPAAAAPRQPLPREPLQRRRDPVLAPPYLSPLGVAAGGEGVDKGEELPLLGAEGGVLFPAVPIGPEFARLMG